MFFFTYFIDYYLYYSSYILRCSYFFYKVNEGIIYILKIFIQKLKNKRNLVFKYKFVLNINLISLHSSKKYKLGKKI